MFIYKTVTKVLSLTKIEHTIFSLPMVLVGAWFGMNNSLPNLMTTILIIIATFGARIFGMTLNRIFDRTIDALNTRTSNREIPSGKVSVRFAYFIAFSGLFIYFLSCAALGEICLKLSLIPLIPLFFYSFLKRFTVLCHFGIGVSLALAPLAAFIATSGHTKFSLQVIIFSIFVFFWLSGSDIIYAILDIENDLLHSIHSLPAKLGNKGAQKVAGLLHIIAIAFIGLIILLNGVNFLSLASFSITIFLFIIMYVPSIPIAVRFFPLSSFAGIFGAITSMLA